MALLRLDGVDKAFGGVRALAGVGFAVDAGTVHGLIGPNGAGKTTVINAISGLQRADAGTIHLAEQRIERLPAHRIAALGIRRTFQNIRLFPQMTARENVTVGQHLRRRHSWLAGLLFSPGSRRQERNLGAAALAALARVGIAAQADAVAGTLAYGDQRRLEIARALAGAPRLLLLDEPAAGMNETETHTLGELVRSLAGDGLTVVLIEHNVRLVMEVCDRITVLDFGRVIADGVPAAIAVDPAVLAAYLGTDDDDRLLLTGGVDGN